MVKALYSCKMIALRLVGIARLAFNLVVSKSTCFHELVSRKS